MRRAAAPARTRRATSARSTSRCSRAGRRTGSGPSTGTELERVVRLAVRFLDDVIEVNPYPLPEIDETVKANRRIGLGVMGWADLLFRLGIPYDSQAALDLGRPAHGVHQREGARPVGEARRGARAVPELDRGPSTSTGARSGTRRSRPSRPPGTISMIAGCSSGIEPAFALAFSTESRSAASASCPSSTRSSSGWRGSAASTPTRSWRRSPSAASSMASPGVPGGRPAGVRDGARDRVRVARAAPGAPSRSPPTTACPRPSTCPTRPRSTTSPAPTSWPGSWAASASRCSATAARRAGPPRRDEVGQGGQARRGGRRAAAGRRQAAAAQPHRARRTASRRRSARPSSPSTSTATAIPSRSSSGGQGRIGHDGGGRGPGPPDLARPPDAVPAVDQAPPRGDRRPALADRRRAARSGSAPQRVLSLPDGIARVLAEHLGQARVEEAEPPAAPAAKLVAGDLCPECGQATFVYEEGCKKCYGCGFNEC